MIVLVGASGSGKTSVAKELEKRGYSRVVTYTTRPMRNGEKDGVDYHFLSDEDFDTIKDCFVEHSTYRGWEYGCGISIRDIDNKNSVVILTPCGMRKLKKSYPNSLIYPNKIFVVYLNVDRNARLVKILQRGDNVDEAYRRNLSDVGMFDGVENEADVCIKNDGYILSVEEIADMIERDYNG